MEIRIWFFYGVKHGGARSLFHGVTRSNTGLGGDVRDIRDSWDIRDVGDFKREKASGGGLPFGKIYLKSGKVGANVGRESPTKLD